MRELDLIRRIAQAATTAEPEEMRRLLAAHPVSDVDPVNLMDMMFHQRVWSMVLDSVLQYGGEYWCKALDLRVRDVMLEVGRRQSSALARRVITHLVCGQKEKIDLSYVVKRVHEHRRAYEREFKRLAGVMSRDFGEDVLFLKGQTVGQYYPQGITRDAVDIDLFVRNDEILWNVLRILRERGFSIRIDVRSGSHGASVECLCVARGGIISVDVHLNHKCLIGNTFWDQDLWQDIIWETIGDGVSVYTVKLEQRLLFLLLHAVHHGYVSVRDRSDFVALSSQPSLHWVEVFKECDRFGVTSLLREMIKMAYAVYGLECPQAVSGHTLGKESRLRSKAAQSILEHSSTGPNKHELPYKLVYLFEYWSARQRFLRLLTGVFLEFIRLMCLTKNPLLRQIGLLSDRLICLVAIVPPHRFRKFSPGMGSSGKGLRWKSICGRMAVARSGNVIALSTPLGEYRSDS